MTPVAIDTTGATFIIAAVSYNTGLTPTITDSKGNTWTPLTASTVTGTVSERLYYAANPVVGTGYTFSNTATSNFSSICVAAGTIYDALSGLNHAVARYENSSRGQFISEDPVFLGDPRQQVLTDPQSLNGFSYANDNPIVRTDPNGRCPICFVAAALIGSIVIGNGLIACGAYAHNIDLVQAGFGLNDIGVAGGAGIYAT
jgi:RHS repeat-associated protein